MADLNIQKNPWNFAGWLSYINPADYDTYTGYYYLTYNSAKFKNKEKVSITIGNETFWNVGSFTDSSSDPSVRVWRITPTDFAPYVDKLASLGNGSAYASQEQITFHIEDKNNSSIHAEAVGQVRAKPQPFVDLIGLSYTAGTVTNEKNKEITWNYVGSDHDGVYNSVKVELIPSSGTIITKYVNTASRKFSIAMSELKFKTWYNLKLTIGFRSNSGTFYRYSNGWTTTISNFVKRDPTPTSTVSVSGNVWGVVRDEKARTLSWSYPSNSGIANNYKVEFINTSTGNTDYTYDGTSTSISVGMSKLNIGVAYNLQIMAYYRGISPDGQWVFNGPTTTIPNWVTRNPIPNKLVTCTPSSLGVVRDEQMRDLQFKYTSSNANGIMNKIRIELLKSDNTVVYDKTFSQGYTIDVEKVVTWGLGMSICDINSPMKIRVTPYFNEYAGTPNTYSNIVTRNPTPTTGVIISSTVGIVKDLQPREFRFSYLPNNTNGIVNYYHLMVIDETTSEVVYSRTGTITPVIGSVSNVTVSFEPKTLPFGHYMTLSVLGGFRVSDNEIYNSDNPTAKSQYVKFDPTPTGEVTVNPLVVGKIADEQVKRIKFSYTLPATSYGIANSFRVDTYLGATFVDTTQLPPTLYDYSIDPTKYSLLDKYTLKITAQYFDGVATHNGAVTTKTDYFYRDPTPTVAPTLTLNPVATDRNGMALINRTQFYVVATFPSECNYTSFKIKVFDDNNVYHEETVTVQNTPSGNNKSAALAIKTVDWNLPIGTPLDVQVTPVAIVQGQVLVGTNATATYSKKLYVDFGLVPIQKLSPKVNNVTWFASPNVEDNPTFRVIFQLPYDKNFQYLTEQEQEDYQYANIRITCNGEVFNLSSDSIGLTDGVASHNSIVIFKLGETARYISPIVINGKKTYTLRIIVTSPYGTVTDPTEFVINVVPFPVSMSTYTDEGKYITAQKTNELLAAERIMRSFISNSVITNPEVVSEVYTKGDTISYQMFKPIIDTVEALYDITKDLNNPNKYLCPMMLVDDGTAPAPMYKVLPSSGDASDRIYQLSQEKIPSLTAINVKPEDYDTTCNEYLQKSENYVFRSVNSAFTSGKVYTSDTNDYNVLYSYYLLLKSMATSVLEEDVDGFIAGTIIELENIKVSSVTSYALSNLPNVTSLTLPVLSTYLCDGDTSLSSVIIGENVTSIPNYCFRNCHITEITLLNPDQVVTATNTSFGNTTYISQATILVPSDLVDDYKADSWWSTYENHIQAFDT